jgi:hypothetical protein
MNACESCRRELVEGEGVVCNRCWNSDFDRAKVFANDCNTIVQKHVRAAAYFSRCRTTKERVERVLTDVVELLELMSDYVRGGEG